MAPARVKGAAKRAAAETLTTATKETTTTVTTVLASVPVEALIIGPCEPEFSPGVKSLQDYEMRCAPVSYLPSN